MEAGDIHAGFFLGLLFSPEDGGVMFLRNVGWPPTEYTVLYLRNHRCENLKSYISVILLQCNITGRGGLKINRP
jgi:hypothetical protein